MPTAVAPFVAAFRRRLANLPGPVRSSGEVSNGEPVTIELLVAGVWVDITSYCLVRDNSGRVTITSGIRGEGSQTERAQAGLELRNDDGRFSPRNPTGEYYDDLNWRNAQIRISVPDGLGGKSYQIRGEASEWIPNWDSTGNDVWTDVTVNGIIQRLAQGPTPERSVIYQAIADPPLDSLVAYWPCEDPAGSTRMASGLVNGAPMTFTGSPGLASYEGFGASDPLPTLAGASLRGNAEYDTTSVTRYQMRFLLAVPDGGFSDLDVISRLRVAEVAAGVSLLNYFDIHYNDPPGGVGAYGAPGTLSIQSYDGDEATVGAGASISLDVRGRHLRVSLENSISSTTMTVTLRVLDINSGVTDSASYTISSTSMSRVMSMTLAPDTLAGDAGVTGAAAGHLSLQTTITDIDDLGRAIQPLGEAAGRRIQRLCGEEGIPFQWIGDLDNTVALGAQGKQNTLTLVQEAVQADGGLLYETTSALGLGYRTRTSLYNQDPALTLSYTGYNLNEVPIPVTDDRYVQNQVVVTAGGVSQTYEKTDGPLGTEAIGVYGENSGVTLNLATTDEATIRSHAAWLVHLGTVEDERFPQISVNLAHPSITPDMRRAILALRPGDRIQVTGMPQPWMAPDTVDQLLLGATQSISRFEHRLTFECAPASPYSIGVLDAVLAKADTDGSRLAADATSGATSLSVEVTDGPLWTTDPTKVPFDIRAGGEVMTVTAITSWLDDTFTRTVASGWGTPDIGAAWSNVGGGSASDYAVNGSIALHTLSTVDTTRRSGVTAAHADFDLYCDISTSDLATGDSLYGAVTARMADASNMYMCRAEFTTSNTVLVTLRQMVAGTQTQLGTYTVPVTHVAGQFIRVRFQGRGTQLKARAWLATDLEPGSWHIEATNSALSAANQLGTRSVRVTGNTNAASVAIQYDNYEALTPQTFTVTRSVNGVTKAQTAQTSVSLAHPTTIALGGDPMAYPDIAAGEDITAGLLTSMLPVIVPKAATESVTASTTMQNDDELFASVAVSATYAVQLHLFHDADTTGDIKIGWSGPTGATMNWGAVVAHVNETSSGTVTAVSMQTRIISETQDIGGGASTGTYSVVHGTLITSTTAGTLNFQWAQRSSSATATNVRAGSMLIMHRSA
jgi:hypothetical protein